VFIWPLAWAWSSGGYTTGKSPILAAGGFFDSCTASS
jgi:hypothetical protein